MKLDTTLNHLNCIEDEKEGISYPEFLQWTVTITLNNNDL